MFTSDVSARGMDYPDISCVMQVGCRLLERWSDLFAGWFVSLIGWSGLVGWFVLVGWLEGLVCLFCTPLPWVSFCGVNAIDALCCLLIRWVCRLIRRSMSIGLGGQPAQGREVGDWSGGGFFQTWICLMHWCGAASCVSPPPQRLHVHVVIRGRDASQTHRHTHIYIHMHTHIPHTRTCTHMHTCTCTCTWTCTGRGVLLLGDFEGQSFLSQVRWKACLSVVVVVGSFSSSFVP
jgi:hypothetical protein